MSAELALAVLPMLPVALLLACIAADARAYREQVGNRCWSDTCVGYITWPTPGR